MFIKENCIIKKIKYVEEKFQRNFPRVDVLLYSLK
jgi:hypothetical protein